jgi:hypothetical protein
VRDKAEVDAVNAVTPAFQGEIQFRRYSDTSTQGQQVVFAVQDREALESFVGMEGKRFMAVLVQIGDDEQPIPSNPGELKKPREYLGAFCWRAVQWSSDAEFQKWLCMYHGKRVRTADEAATFIKEFCGVKSRKDLDTNDVARKIFTEHFMAPWQKYQLARRSA